MFGSHLSIAGSMVNALLEAERLKMDCVQVFTKNQRQWRAPPLKDSERDTWLAKLRKMKWDRNDGPARVVSHNSYLINLASPDLELRRKSIALQREEIERCEALSIPLCVAHPGAHLGAARKPNEPNDLDSPPGEDERAGLARIAEALDQIHHDLPGYRTVTCLETTVGSGTNLGYSFHHLAWLREHVKEPDRVGFCFDTCHVAAAGYDMTNDPKGAAVLRRFDNICGLKHLRVFHLNDSVCAVGSRKDRHAHIGLGACGLSAFRIIVNRPAFRNVPKVLETPKEQTKEGEAWDVVNIRCLKRLMRPRESSR